MVTEIYMPKMTDFMEAGVIVNWLVKEGEKVDRGQPLLEVETDKATSEVEAPTEGFLIGIRPGRPCWRSGAGWRDDCFYRYKHG